MGSSEIVDSGRFAGQKPTFAQACSLLSQYLKKKGSFGDLRLGLNPNFEPNNGVPAKTMNLLPMIEKNNADAPATEIQTMPPVNLFPHQAGFGPVFPKEDVQKNSDTMRAAKLEIPERAPMTIFYAGQVLVFNDFPAEKAKEIMLLASKGIGSPNAVQAFTTNMVPKPVESAAPAPTLVPPPASMIQANVNDLPIARKASLTRFLEKRKDRITARAPYPVEVAASHKPAESKPWMRGMGARFPVQMEERH